MIELTHPSLWRTVRDNRTLAAAVVFAIASLMALCAVLAVLLLQAIRSAQSPTLGSFTDPLILNRVPGHEGPAAREGDIITYRGERCANRATVIESTVFYQASAKSVQGEQVTSNLLDGCTTPAQQLAMPSGVQPGDWKLGGIVRDKSSGEVRYWNSESFKVVP